MGAAGERLSLPRVPHQSKIRTVTKGDANGTDRLKEIKAQREELRLALATSANSFRSSMLSSPWTSSPALEVNNVPARYS